MPYIKPSTEITMILAFSPRFDTRQVLKIGAIFRVRISEGLVSLLPRSKSSQKPEPVAIAPSFSHEGW